MEGQLKDSLSCERLLHKIINGHVWSLPIYIKKRKRKKEHDCVWKQLVSIVFIYIYIYKVFGNFYIKYVIKC